MIGPMRIQMPPAPVGPPELVLARQLFQAFADDFLAGAVGTHAARNVDADRQFLGLVERIEKIDPSPAAVAIGDAGDAVGVVQGEQLFRRLRAAIAGGWPSGAPARP